MSAFRRRTRAVRPPLDGSALNCHTYDTALRFSNGHFTMIGLRVDGKPLLRAYSIASPNYEEHLEFLSIKVENGPLRRACSTSKWVTPSSSAKSPPAPC